MTEDDPAIPFAGAVMDQQAARALMKQVAELRRRGIDVKYTTENEVWHGEEAFQKLLGWMSPEDQAEFRKILGLE